MTVALGQLARICQGLPEVTTAGDQHLALEVRGKRFAWCLDDHHGDGRLALVCKAAPGVNTALVYEDDRRFFIPAYVGPRGWIGVRLDVGPVDWDRVEQLLIDGYRLVAPKRLASQVVAA